MALFEFELARVEDILPWTEPGKQSLSWFALTDGRFRIVVGKQELFRYSDEILSHWDKSARDAEYQVAAFARDILGSVAAAVAPLPKRIEGLASNWHLLMQLQKPLDDSGAVDDDLWYEAWRWLGERSPCTSYLVASPKFQFVRVGAELRIHWDNREQVIDGLPVWTARHGVHVISAEAFLDECQDFSQRLLSAMDDRISELEAGTVKPQCAVDTISLRDEQEAWRAEFATYYSEYQPDVPWQETEKALLAIAARKGLYF